MNEYIILSIIIILIIIIYIIDGKNGRSMLLDMHRDKATEYECFGGLQSLYSNDGIQDAYLTLENDISDPRSIDPYSRWRRVIWDLPTRNLSSYSFMYNP